MTILQIISLYLMAALYVFAGVSHFTRTKFFLKIVPPMLPYHLAIVYISGVAEILLGIALVIPALKVQAAWGIIILLIAVFPANIYMLTARLKGEKFRKIPVWTLWLRLALQFALIYWACSHTF